MLLYQSGSYNIVNTIVASTHLSIYYYCHSCGGLALSLYTGWSYELVKARNQLDTYSD